MAILRQQAAFAEQVRTLGVNAVPGNAAPST